MGMQFVSGRVSHLLDAKHRTRIPAKFRNAFPSDEKLHYVQYTSGCIAIMCTSIMEKRLLSFGEIDPADEDVISAKRYLYSLVDDVVEDGQGRIMIPKEYRDYAGLKTNLVTIGMGDYIEIWDQDNLKQAMGGMSVGTANKIKQEYKDRTHE